MAVNVITKNNQATEDDIVQSARAYRNALHEAKRRGNSSCAYATDEYSCTERSAMKAAQAYQRQVAYNATAQAAGLVSAGNTALGI